MVYSVACTSSFVNRYFPGGESFSKYLSIGMILVLHILEALECGATTSRPIRLTWVKLLPRFRLNHSILNTIIDTWLRILFRVLIIERVVQPPRAIYRNLRKSQKHHECVCPDETKGERAK